MTDHPAEREDVAACRVCGREIESCAFCESERCRHSICYRCLSLRLGQAYSYVNPRDDG